MPAGAVRQSCVLCTSWQVLPRAKQLRSRLKRCLAVSFSFSSSLFLRAAAAAFLCFFIPFLGLQQRRRRQRLGRKLDFRELLTWGRRGKKGAGKWWSGLTLALLCCPAGRWINSTARLPVLCTFRDLLTCKLRSSSSSVLSLKPQRIEDAYAFLWCTLQLLQCCIYLLLPLIIIWRGLQDRFSCVRNGCAVWNERFLPLPLGAGWILSLSPPCALSRKAVCSLCVLLYRRALPLPFCRHWAAALLLC